MTSLFIKSLLDMLSDLGDVRSRAMFGGYGIYRDGVMIGLIADGVFYLKVGGATLGSPTAVNWSCQNRLD